MTTRRKFIQTSALATVAVALGLSKTTKAVNKKTIMGTFKKPIVISTWKHGMEANVGAWKVLGANGTALDAVEKGVMVSEDDFTNLSVGLGGLPDRDGIVTLDASIMDEKAPSALRPVSAPPDIVPPQCHFP